MAEKTLRTVGLKSNLGRRCVLRGNLDASEYKSVVLGLIFLKYISDCFEEKYQQLVAVGNGFEG